MKTKQLGNSDLFITPVGFGAWAIGGSGWEFAWGAQDDNAVHRGDSSRAGTRVNWIDTAAVYGTATLKKSWPARCRVGKVRVLMSSPNVACVGTGREKSRGVEGRFYSARV